MGFFSEIIGAGVKAALTPVAVDITEVVAGNEPENTAKLIDSAAKSVSKSIDDLCDGEL